MGNVQMLLRQHVGAPCAPCVEVGACLLYTSDAADD